MLLQELNYRALLIFHTVVTHGSVSRAAESLGISQPAVSMQLRRLEEQLQTHLLRRSGRGIAPTEMGQLIARYTDDIFSVSREMLQAARAPDGSYAAVVNVGIADVVPQLLGTRLLEPIISLPDQHLRVFTGHPTDLLAELAIHKLDVVISDAPINEPVHHVRAFNHLLGSSSTSVLATPVLAEQLREGFPHSLEGAPLLMPTANTVLRRSLDHWLDTIGVQPSLKAEFEDPTSLMVFGEQGLGVFMVPTVVASECAQRFHVQHIGEIPAVAAHFYAISTERRIRHPAVAALSKAAHESLFS